MSAPAQKAPKGPRLPVILIASDFLDGDTVFAADPARTDADFTRDPALVAVAHDAQAVATLEAVGARALAARRVVDVYLAEVAIDAAGRPRPLHFRERFRMTGPSHRPDLGKQAEFPQPDA